MSASVTRSFKFQSRSPLTGTSRTYRVSVTSSPTGYAARVTELVAGGGEVPVMLPDGPRYGLSPSNFHALRRHYRGELVGEIRAELRRDAVQPISRLPHAAGLDACVTATSAPSKRRKLGHRAIRVPSTMIFPIRLPGNRPPSCRSDDGSKENTTMDAKTMIDDARRYREQEALVGKGGVVVLFQGEVQGWVNQLRNPEHWRPGCIAVDEQGRMWTGIAGSERDGALMWLANHEL